MRNDKKLIKDVKRMTEKECMTIKEISKVLCISEITVKRIRKENNICKRDMSLRKDKKYICSYCSTEAYVRRNEPIRLLCPTCRRNHRKL